MHLFSAITIQELAKVLIPLAALIVGGVIAVVAMVLSHQRRKLWHETARLALEKGQPLPSPEPEHHADTPSAKDERREHDLRGGLVLIGVGLGLYLFFLHLSPPGIYGLAFLATIPGFIGIALILHWLITALLRSKKSDSTPPRS
jgi:hypothetical protein